MSDLAGRVDKSATRVVQGCTLAIMAEALHPEGSLVGTLLGAVAALRLFMDTAPFDTSKPAPASFSTLHAAAIACQTDIMRTFGITLETLQ